MYIDLENPKAAIKLAQLHRKVFVSGNARYVKHERGEVDGSKFFFFILEEYSRTLEIRKHNHAYIFGAVKPYSSVVIVRSMKQDVQ